MKIYTKTGDQGKTSLVGGKRVSKGDDRINAYGTIDELNSHIGLLRDCIENERHMKILQNIQENLFVAGSRLASEKGKIPNYLHEIDEDMIKELEEEIDWMNTSLEQLKNFILPGGSPLISYCHIARCVCRRAERLLVKLGETDYVEQNIVIYLNRLSDYLFTLARKVAKDSGIEEIAWKAR